MRERPQTLRIAAAAAVLLAMVVTSTACSTTPFRELWQRFGLGRPDLAELDPAAIRAGIKLPLPARPRAEGAALSLEFRPARSGGELETHRFPLVLVNQGRAVRAEDLPAAEPGYNWYLFKLTPAAERQLTRLREELTGGTGDAAETGAIAVLNQYRNAVPGQKLTRSVWIKLSRTDGFFALVENETVTIGEDGKVLR